MELGVGSRGQLSLCSPPRCHRGLKSCVLGTDPGHGGEPTRAPKPVGGLWREPGAEAGTGRETGGGEKQSGHGWILKVELVGSADRLDEGCEE